MAAAIATAEVSEPPRPSVVMRPVSLCMPWKPAITATSLVLLEALDQFGAVDVENARRAMRVVGEDRQLPALPGARVDAHAFQHDGQQPGGDLFAGGHHGVVFARVVQHGGLRHQSTSWLVAPAMAETTTATSWPASTSRLTWRATLRMRSISATDVPPNFITRRAMTFPDAPKGANKRPAVPAAKGAYTYRRGGRDLQHHCRAGNAPEHGAGIGPIRDDIDPARRSTVDEAEVERFSRHAADWWDARGPMAALHKFNPVGSPISATRRRRAFRRDPKKLDCLKGLRMLDIGCGGGILSEPLARLGAQMVGADPARRKYRGRAARMPQESGVAVDYRATTAEDLAAAGERFDVVLAMEVVEHVADVTAVRAHLRRRW